MGRLAKPVGITNRYWAASAALLTMEFQLLDAGGSMAVATTTTATSAAGGGWAFGCLFAAAAHDAEAAGDDAADDGTGFRVTG